MRSKHPVLNIRSTNTSLLSISCWDWTMSARMLQRLPLPPPGWSRPERVRRVKARSQGGSLMNIVSISTFLQLGILVS